MKKQNIAVRMDNMGRIYVPQYIRTMLHIQEEELLEIYIDGKDGILFKKYAPIDEPEREL